jgi:hypothetical protein
MTLPPFDTLRTQDVRVITEPSWQEAFVRLEKFNILITLMVISYLWKINNHPLRVSRHSLAGGAGGS